MQYCATRWLSASTWWSAAWPLLVAGAATIALRQRGRVPAALRLPPGDLVVPIERALRACAGFAPALTSMLRGIRLPARRIPAGHKWSAELAVQLARWPVTGLLWLVLTILLLLLLATGR